MAQKKKVEARAKTAAKPVARKAPATPVKAAKAKTAAPPKMPVLTSKAKPVAPVAIAPKVSKKVPPTIQATPLKSNIQVGKPHAAKLETKAASTVAPQAAKKPAGAVSGPLKAGTAPHLRPGTQPLRPATQAATGRAVPAAVQKPGGQKLTAPVAVQPMTPKAIAEKAAAARQMLAVQKKPVNQRHGFKSNEFIVYPAHGVGRIVGIEEQEIAGMALELFVITFEKEKLTLRVPTGKLASVGMRKLADDAVVKRAMDTLKGRARVKRTMWSRRAQEYVAKINSGDLVSIAEVVRDLYRSEAQPEQSYSERQLYEDALDRMAREIAAVEKLDERGAVQRITEILSKSAKSRRLASEGEAAAVVEAA